MSKEMSVQELAHNVLTLTLHGPVPIETVAKLAQGVLDLHEGLDGALTAHRLQTDLREKVDADAERLRHNYIMEANTHAETKTERDELRRRAEGAERERDKYRETNESVATCADHTERMFYTQQLPCLACKIDELTDYIDILEPKWLIALYEEKRLLSQIDQLNDGQAARLRKINERIYSWQNKIETTYD